MGNLSDFILYLNEQAANHSIYVWGAQGQQGTDITEAWIRKCETSDKNAERAIAYWREQCEAGYGGVLRAFDCSGLGVYFLLERGLIRSDMTAHGLMRNCLRIPKRELRTGDFVFHVNLLGKASHIGYVVDRARTVIEARGRDYGVVKGGLDGRWNAYGRPLYWVDDEVAQLEGTGQRDFMFTRVLKYGVRGEDVCALKRLLLSAGFGGLTLSNQNFLSATRNTVKRYQQAHGLVVDGKAGRETIASLGGVWNG